MEFTRADKFKLVTYQNIDVDERNVVTLLYQPLIGSDAFSLYLTFWALIDRSRLGTPEYNHSKIFDLLSISPIEFIAVRKKLEAIGLLVVYQNDNLYLYELKAPLSAEEFIKAGILGPYLFTKVGRTNFDELINLFKLSSFEKSGFKNITTNFDEVFSTSKSKIEVTEDLISRSKSCITINHEFDFDVFFEGLSKNFVDHRKITKRIKDKIQSLSYVYDLDEFEMQKVFMDAVDKDKNVDFDMLSKRARFWFQFDNKTNDLVLQEKGKHKGTEDLSRDEILKYCKTENPRHIIEFLFNSKPSTSELRIVEQLLDNVGLSVELVNFLIVYVIGQTGSFPTYGYFEKVAIEWQRNKLTNMDDAIKFVKNRQNNQKPKRYSKNEIPKDIEPDWLKSYMDKL
jgi:replication initiation and membrane attachment protein